MSDGDTDQISGIPIGSSFTDAEARIFFEPTNPEKKINASYSSDYLPPARSSPALRSPKLSTATEPSPVAGTAELIGGEAAIIERDEELFGSSRSLTPENEGFIQDEPSSVLASRIMRAHDNPSPPPQSPEDFQHLNLPTLSLPFPLIPTIETPSDTSTPPSPPDISIPIPQLAEDVYGPSISAILPLKTPTKSRLPNHIVDQPLSIDTQTSCMPAAQPNVTPIASTDPPPTDTIDEQVVVDALVPSTDETETMNIFLPDAQDSSKESSRESPRRSSRPRRRTARYSSPIRPETSELEIDVSETDGPGPSNKTTTSDSVVIQTLRRKAITLVPDNVQKSELSLFNAQPRSRSPTRKSASKTKRELGSLSPSSSTILKSLLPPAASLSPTTETFEPKSDPSTQPPFEPAAARPTPPIRFTSPTRKALPNKFQLQPADLDNPNRTPARRIPIQTAVANGQISAQKAVRLMSQGPATTTSTRPVFNIPSTDSPVRRVLLNGSVGSPNKMLLSSPLRSRSVEPNPVETMRLNTKKRSESVEPVPSRGHEKASPFPRLNSAERVLVPPKTNLSLHPPIPEEGPNNISNQKLQSSGAQRPATLEKSRLKQPTSKIPRIGLKPYARPPVSSTSKSQEKPSTLRVIDSAKPQPSSLKLKTSNPTRYSHIPVSSPTKQRGLVPGTPTNLKRKRGPENHSPTKPTPVVLLSKRPAGPSSSPVKHGVPPLRMVSESDGVLPSRSSAGSIGSSGTEGMQTTESSTPQTNARPITLRMVSENDGILPDRSIVISGTSTNEKERSPPPSALLATVPQPMVAPYSPARDEIPPCTDTIPDSSDPAEHVPSPAESSEFTFRRTTRSSRNGTVATKTVSSSRPPPARRKNVPTFTDTGPFSGMTALALRTLTDSNTTKNKEYVTVSLKTEVVRKEGARPESPGMNVKSISQKEKEAKMRERSARAERRSQRDNSKEVVTDENDAGEDEEESGNGWEGSPSDYKHSWGPGDEEDYETPIQPIKRLRHEDVSEEQEDYDKKRVKWDRGLYKEIYLDEIKPRTTHARIAQESIKKGCLTPTAKTRQLDTLGNLPNAESPLKDIVTENIVVKKFVYDSDIVEPVATTPIKTRSQSKKSKS
ncbi:hypothetical protein J3R30DRAFT_875144 [Lentinula aciculospora]|uniref:Uncharacterized protein n=1 Tax=Lentinula aciculospora TaxID=153920 RepID=A0A9W9AQ79_9AGAR|nr:hypothetical protein J3R30DRAFT_875144 [Lentinula aciculospora]